MSVSYGGSSITFEDGSIVSSGSQGFKNKIINGAMVIDQRYNGASANNIPGNIYVMDRWAFNGQVGDKYSARMVSTANSSASNYESTAAPTGFTNSIKVTTVSANTTVTNTLFAAWQAIEGYNVADLDYGTANAKTVTVSFWTKSSLIGTFSVAVLNGLATRCYATTYTINSANTWEYKTVTIPGCTDGTWYKDNQLGMYLFFGLGGGSTYSVGTNNTWDTNSAKYHATGATSVIATLGATWYVTGVQLEKGTTASSFEYRSYQKELFLCQRYYQTMYVGIVTNGGQTGTNFNYTVPMRAAPTATRTGSTGIGSGGVTASGFLSDYGWVYNSGGNTNSTYTLSSEL
jgi:hypothetical protein